ncbi:MAG TPA: hypothetical protein DCG69_05335 [Bacteroidales bacterium]|nr:hypothetical protein [Bacteroidales bacterium]
MKLEQIHKRPFLLKTSLFVLSVMLVLFDAGIVYTWFFFDEAKKGLETYLSAAFLRFPFWLIFSLLIFIALIFSLSVLLMWFRNKFGLFLFSSLTFAFALLLLFAEQVDWFNLIVLLVMSITLLMYTPYFTENHQINKK